MNKEHKLFLNELNCLCKKYSINQMLVFNGRITFKSNNGVLAFISYRNDTGNYGNDVTYRGILTQEDEYEIVPGELIEGD